MRILLILVFIIGFFSSASGQTISQDESVEYLHFTNLAASNVSAVHDKSIKYLDKTWKPSYSIMVLELMYYTRNYRLQVKLLDLLEKNTKKSFSYDFDAWYEYLWNKAPQSTSYYHKFKSFLYQAIDKKFLNYFLNREEQSLIRFDEIRWGGVKQDGIPPLRNPKMITAMSAQYLSDTDIVFGIAVNGDYRAYPKRILAWHEMFTDDVGGVPVAGVYCTLCGTVILYKTQHKGIKYELGTSGFLYRSNKLMYDKKTQSLWNTIWGKPVVGPLINKGIKLDYLSVVTTTWGEWKTRHPETTVLDLNTGFNRNYDEGVAYKDYFATDKLMFNVPRTNKKLKNKASILAIRLAEYPEESLAISTSFLGKNKLYVDAIKAQRFIVVTDGSGANRVYEIDSEHFVEYDKNSTLTDDKGGIWTLYEDRLENKAGKTLKRISTFNAFWFGWYSAYPNTRLVK